MNICVHALFIFPLERRNWTRDSSLLPDGEETSLATNNALCATTSAFYSSPDRASNPPTMNHPIALDAQTPPPLTPASPEHPSRRGKAKKLPISPLRFFPRNRTFEVIQEEEVERKHHYQKDRITDRDDEMLNDSPYLT